MKKYLILALIDLKKTYIGLYSKHDVTYLKIYTAAIQIKRYPPVIGYGTLQPLADGLKLLIKELIIPLKANKYLFSFSPVLFLSLSFAIWAAVPFEKFVTLSPNLAILVFLAFSSLSVYGILLGVWSSNSRHAFLGRRFFKLVNIQKAMHKTKGTINAKIKNNTVLNQHSTLLLNISQSNLYSRTVLSSSIITHCIQKRYTGKKSGEAVGEVVGKAIENNVPKVTPINPNMGVIHSKIGTPNNRSNPTASTSNESNRSNEKQPHVVNAHKEMGLGEKNVPSINATSDNAKASKTQEQLDQLNARKYIKYQDTVEGGKNSGGATLTSEGNRVFEKVRDKPTVIVNKAPSEFKNPEFLMGMLKSTNDTVIPIPRQTHPGVFMKGEESYNFFLGYLSRQKKGTIDMQIPVMNPNHNTSQVQNQYYVPKGNTTIVDKSLIEQNDKWTEFINSNNASKTINDKRNYLTSRLAEEFKGQGVTQEIKKKKPMSHPEMDKQEKKKKKQMEEQAIKKNKFKKKNEIEDNDQS